MDIEIKITLADDRIVSLFSDMTVGADYWANIDDSWRTDAKNQLKGIYYSCYEEKLWNYVKKGGKFIVRDVEDDDVIHIIDLSAIKNGLAVMAEIFPHDFADILIENDDATTGDLFLQCCCFPEQIRQDGEAIFG